MFWFNRNKRKPVRRKSIVKKRSFTAERILFFFRRVGLTLAVFVLIGWVGAWFFMSGTSSHVASWADNKILNITKGVGFEVANILVEGRNYTDVDTLKAIININKGDPLLAFKPELAQEMIEKLSWVKSAEVERRFPDTIYVGLIERTPMALWQRNKRLSLIDTEGAVLTDDKLDRFKNLVIVVGDSVPEQAPDFLKILAAQPEIMSRVEAAKIISNRRWDLTLKNGVTVKLPEGDTPLALSRLLVVQEEEALMDKDVNVIDVRDNARITVRTKPGAVQEYRSGYQTTSHTGSPI